MSLDISLDLQKKLSGIFLQLCWMNQGMKIQLYLHPLRSVQFSLQYPAKFSPYRFCAYIVKQMVHPFLFWPNATNSVFRGISHLSSEKRWHWDFQKEWVLLVGSLRPRAAKVMGSDWCVESGVILKCGISASWARVQ